MKLINLLALLPPLDKDDRYDRSLCALIDDGRYSAQLPVKFHCDQISCQNCPLYGDLPGWMTTNEADPDIR